MPQLVSAAVSAFVQLILLAGVPLLVYALYLRFRHHEGTRTALMRAGLGLGERRYLWWSALLALGLALLVPATFMVLEPPIDPLTRQGSALHTFFGLGLSGKALVLALLYGVIQTGLIEEVLFRGLIAGALSRRMSLLRANLVQASIFLLPHLLLLLVAPELWPLLILIFVIGLVLGWLRIRSGSILGPWLIHAASNTAMALAIAAQTATCPVTGCDDAPTRETPVGRAHLDPLDPQRRAWTDDGPRLLAAVVWYPAVLSEKVSGTISEAGFPKS